MSQAVRLIPLMCPRCQTAVPAKPDEVAWVCEQCGQGMLLDMEHGSSPLDVFFSKAIPQNTLGSPYWVSRGVVTITRRETYQGDKGRDAQKFWETPRLFFVPAWKLAVGEIVTQGVRLLREPARMEVGSRTKFQPVVLGWKNVKPLAEFMVMSIEAERSDAMKELVFTIQLDPPQLWIVA